MEKSSKKIALISVFYPFRGGIAQFNANIYSGLLKLGHDVEVFNFSRQYPSILFPGKTQFIAEEDNAEEIPSQRIIDSIAPLSYKKTVKKVLEFNPDMVVIGYWMPFMGPSLGYISGKLLKQNKNVVTIVHNALPHEKSRLDKVLSDYFFKRSKKIIALSQTVEKQIKLAYPNLETTTLRHPAYEHFGTLLNRKEALLELNLPESPNYLLFFGLIRGYKGLDVLLQSIALLPSNYQVIVAGEVYGSFKQYEKIIKENQLEKRVHLFNNYIPDQQVKLFFSVAECCVLPYKSATQSGIVAIAQHFGVPVIASKVGGLHEFIEDGKTGRLVEPVTPQKFSEVIKEFAIPEKLNNARTILAQKNHSISWSDFCENMIAFG